MTSISKNNIETLIINNIGRYVAHTKQEVYVIDGDKPIYYIKSEEGDEYTLLKWKD